MIYRGRRLQPGGTGRAKDLRPRCARQVGERGRGQCSGSRRGEKRVLGGMVKGHGRGPVILCETLSTHPL